MPLQPGAMIGGYRVIQVLGSGGMGTVYLAQNPILPRRDALKVLSADLSTDPEFRARFEREANLAAGLDHPSIVKVYSRGEEDGQLWIAMQYVQGTDAAEEVAKGPAAMPPQRALRIVTEVGKGLDYAHRRGLLHRDIKPANFLLSASDDDDEERVYLTDFGVAKSAEDGQDLTSTGNFMATVAYAPPEQLLGERLDHHADIYSLGCSLVKLLTGQNPYPATVPAMVMMGHLHEPPPRVSMLRSGLPPALDDVIARVMAKNPAERYNSCREFTQAAEIALMGASAQYRSPATGYTTPPHSYPVAPQVEYNYTQPTRGTTGPRLAATTPNLNNLTPRRSRSRKFLVPGLAALVVAVAVAAGTYFLTNDGAQPSSTDKVAQAKSSHPQFDGKSVVALRYTNSAASIDLDPSDQTDFLQDLGFRYSPDYRATAGEKSPRQLSMSNIDIKKVDVIVILRSDSQAGNGGMRGLPSALLGTSAKIAIVDDPSAIQAYQVWTDQSVDTLVDKMVPALAKVVT
ncbi:serine/threonine-protein kinase [Nocardia mexicana]|uniref:non-specific serine/threonine protein kinase n=1 Tax=Nocardia mexicana TaxID=279262 RepID=A0A370HCR4_9NOCA|nr:serine/threonine-protein kinase [Nocardia mexicana]RDI52653.1 serine/threonine-protein kinase [Nocardia mexicana]